MATTQRRRPAHARGATVRSSMKRVPTPAQRKARQMNIKKAQAARWKNR